MIFAPFTILILFILALPFLFFFGLFHVLSVGLESIGVSPEAVFGVLLLMLVASVINIPLGKRKLVEVQERSWFGLVSRTKLVAQGLAINVGGAVLPLVLVVYLALHVPVKETAFVTLFMIVVLYFVARVVPGKGIVVPVFIPPVLAAFVAFLFVPQAPAQAAFIAGVLGVLIGADLLHLPQVTKQGGVMSIGGAGVFDGIFLVGVAAAFLAGL
jgi:uncharacterized membrane protein